MLALRLCRLSLCQAAFLKPPRLYADYMSAPDLVALGSEKTLNFINFRHYLFARFLTTLAVQMQSVAIG